MPGRQFRVLVVRLETGSGEMISFSHTDEVFGGSGLAAALYERYGQPGKPADDPEQPLIFAIGPLTGAFPLMSKVVCAFTSPYHDQYTESHAGGRMALALKFAGLDALVILGKAKELSALSVGGHILELRDVHYLKGVSVFRAGKLLRSIFPKGSGHRSIARIGPAGENCLAYACVNVDTYRHFGRMGSGCVMGQKNLKAVIVQGDQVLDLPPGKEYPKLFKEIYRQMTDTRMMSKYHDLGTPQNLIPLNELKSLPWRNLLQTTDPKVEDISGERFAENLLLRNAACSGCPVGCIHVGMLRRQFSQEHRFYYRKVSYDYEPIFSLGSMVGVTDASDVLMLIDECDRLGMDVMSAGVALAWACEASQKGIISSEQTIEELDFGKAEELTRALAHLGQAANEFYRLLGQGTMRAAEAYGGKDFACVLGQEMAGYATGEVFFTSQSMSFRHSHLDTGAYSYDQCHEEKDIEKAVSFLVEDERERCLLTSLVSCLFARGVYKDELVADCLASLGMSELAGNMEKVSGAVQRLRWKMRCASGYDPKAAKIPNRFREVVTWKGPIDQQYLDGLRAAYASAITEMAEGVELKGAGTSRIGFDASSCNLPENK